MLLFAKQGNLAGLLSLIQKRVRLDAVDEAKWGALHHSAARGHIEAVLALLKVPWSRALYLCYLLFF